MTIIKVIKTILKAKETIAALKLLWKLVKIALKFIFKKIA